MKLRKNILIMLLLGGKYIQSDNIFGISEIILPNRSRNFYLKNWYNSLKNRGNYDDFVSAVEKIDDKTLRLFYVNKVNLKYGNELLIYK